ncbi:hypothetical protein ARSEF1564_003692 [Beauveria bassiana]
MVNRGCVECVVYARGPAAQSKLALKVAVGNAAHTSSRYAERPSNLGEAMALRAMGMAAARAEYYQYGAADEGGHRSTAQKKKNLGFAGQSIGRDLFGLVNKRPRKNQRLILAQRLSRDTLECANKDQN